MYLITTHITHCTVNAVLKCHEGVTPYSTFNIPWALFNDDIIDNTSEVHGHHCTTCAWVLYINSVGAWSFLVLTLYTNKLFFDKLCGYLI